jgi:hypothetical protein
MQEMPREKKKSKSCPQVQRSVQNSAFLIQCSAEHYGKPNFELCKQRFMAFKQKHDAFIRDVIVRNIKIHNSDRKKVRLIKSVLEGWLTSSVGGVFGNECTQRSGDHR